MPCMYVYAMHAIYSVRDARAVCGSGYSSVQSGVCGQWYWCVGWDGSVSARTGVSWWAWHMLNSTTTPTVQEGVPKPPNMWVCFQPLHGTGPHRNPLCQGSSHHQSPAAASGTLKPLCRFLYTFRLVYVLAARPMSVCSHAANKRPAVPSSWTPGSGICAHHVKEH